jgi:PleD family two-component response regulator
MEKKQTVLVIDDDKFILALVASTLQETEFKVVKATEGGEGVRFAKQLKPDVILLDIIMPKYDGFMIGKVLKRNKETKDIPIIFLSGKKSIEDINRAIKAGGSDYIVKPFRPSDLIARIRKIIGMKEAIAQLN